MPDTGLRWLIATRSGADGNCVHAEVGHVALVRDSKDRGIGPVLVFTTDQWRQIRDGARCDELPPWVTPLPLTGSGCANRAATAPC